MAYAFTVSFQFWLAIWVVYLTDFRGISLFLVGLLETFFQAVNVFGVVPAGAFADRFGRRRALAIGTLIEGVGLSLFAFAGNFPMLLLSYLLWAGGGTMRDPAASAYLYDALGSGGREADFSRLFGRYTALMSAGFMLGGLIGAPIAGASSLQVPVAISGISYSAALAIVLLLREPPRTQAIGGMTYWRTVAEGGRVLKHDRAIRYLVIITFGLAFAAAANVILMQPFLSRHDVPVAYFGLILVPFRLGAAGASMWAYVVERALGFQRAFGGLVVVPIVLLLALAAIDHVLMVVAIGLISVLGFARQPLVADYLNRRTTSDTRATILALRRFSSSVVMSIGSPIAGALAEGSIRLAFLSLAVATGVVAGPAFFLWRKADREPWPGQSRLDAAARDAAAEPAAVED
ncbi:MAG: MFS transporter [Dehalococcoidia bacterium]